MVGCELTKTTIRYIVIGTSRRNGSEVHRYVSVAECDSSVSFDTPGAYCNKINMGWTMELAVIQLPPCVDQERAEGSAQRFVDLSSDQNVRSLLCPPHKCSCVISLFLCC
jgi:hypothetical protein